ncbi:unnamed protein product [Phytomonas sp. EM1]|nr:unnamed protein product [Phytomonas sp. EM1]|eukprot:CCW60637.1 unnamed protein product [Phytomonas sp. isolate EM1]
MQEAETFDETLDIGEDEAPYLVPRLSAYSPPEAMEEREIGMDSSVHDTENDSDSDESKLGTTSQDERLAEADEIISENSNEKEYTNLHEARETTAEVSMPIGGDECLKSAEQMPVDETLSMNCERVEEATYDVDDGSSAFDTNDAPSQCPTGGERPRADENDDGSPDVSFSARATAAARVDWTALFPLNRVREILRCEGGSSIISREAANAAGEAAALLLRDMAKAAAGEAVRSGRKTITYDDVSRLAQLFDRFSFLLDVIPPATTANLNPVNSSHADRKHRVSKRKSMMKPGMPVKVSEALPERSVNIQKDGTLLGCTKLGEGSFKTATLHASHASVGIGSLDHKKQRF